MLLKLVDIFFRYPGGSEVLRKASFSVDKGEVVSLAGSNGSGKTTLLMIAAGLLEPDKGTVLLEEKPLREQLPEARKRVGLISQDPDDQIFNPTVYDEIAFTLHQILPEKKEIDLKISEMAEKFKLKEILDKPPYRLSVGEKRMVTLASVLAYDPEILLLDEPTANLSTTSIEEVEKTIREAKDTGKAIVVASHDVELIARIADRLYILNDGSTTGSLNVKSALKDESILRLADMKPPLVLQTARLLGLGAEPLTLTDLANTKSKMHQKNAQT